MLPRPTRKITHQSHKPGVSRQPPACRRSDDPQVPPTLKSVKLQFTFKPPQTPGHSFTEGHMPYCKSLVLGSAVSGVRLGLARLITFWELGGATAMSEGQRFCGRCGHELKPTARFCGSCGNSVPGVVGQTAAQESDQPAYAPTATALPVPGPPAVMDERRDRTADPGPSGSAFHGPGKPPPPQTQPGAGPPWRSTPPRTPRRPALLWPLIVGLAVLVAGGGTAAWLFLFRHSSAQSQASVASAPPPSTSFPTTQSQSPPTSPPPPPTQVNLQGVTIGISAVNNDPEVTTVAATLATYFGGIDSRNYKQAWDTYTSKLQSAVPFQQFSNNLQTSQDSQVAVESIQHDANGNTEADVSFQSHQAGQYGPNQGETCTNWSLDYHLVPAVDATSGPVSLSYLIDKVTPIGAGHTSC
jgi:hypothetical protein